MDSQCESVGIVLACDVRYDATCTHNESMQDSPKVVYSHNAEGVTQDGNRARHSRN